MQRWIMCALAASVSLALAQSAPEPWLGVKHPASEPAVIVGERAPRPVSGARGEFDGGAIKRDVDTIVGFSHWSRANQEFGSGQLWGRVSGFASSARTIDWAAQQLREAGIREVRVQTFEQEARAAFWIPLEWEVRLLGDAAFGATRDVVLESAMPTSQSAIDGETVTAPLVFVGGGNPSLLKHVNVQGKITVQLVVPQGHMVFERATVSARTQELFKRGAVAVLNLVRLPGNERSNDFGNCGGVCFNLGGRDGHFLENLLDRAAQTGIEAPLRAQLKLKSRTYRGLKAQNAVAVIPGKSEQTIVIDAHADAWFDGAGDNADGVAVMLSLARHFAKAKQPARTLVFVVSAGHHSPGLNGPRNFVNANPKLADRAVAVINIEHVAQRNFAPARSVGADGYRQTVADSGEAPITFGVSNGAAFFDRLAEVGVARFGVNFVSERSTMQSGETGGFEEVRAPKITIMQAPPLYHTSGENSAVISTPGLERMARFLAHFIAELGKAPRERLSE